MKIKPILASFLLFAFISTPSLAHLENHKTDVPEEHLTVENLEQDLKELQAKRLKRLEEKTAQLKKEKLCIKTAKDKTSLKKCRENKEDNIKDRKRALSFMSCIMTIMEDDIKSETPEKEEGLKFFSCLKTLIANALEDDDEDEHDESHDEDDHQNEDDHYDEDDI